MEEKLYNVKDAASYIGVSESAVYKWAESGVLAGKKYGSVWRFTKEQLDTPQPKAAPPKEKTHGRQIPRPRRELVLPI